MADLCQPDAIHWCDGSEKENQLLLDQMVRSGMAVKLDEKKRPGSYYFQSDRATLHVWRTVLLSVPGNRKMPARQITERSGGNEDTLRSLFRGSMKGRTMYIIPFSMGPLVQNLTYRNSDH